MAQKGKTNLDLNEARDDEVWGRQWHQLDHTQTICTPVQTDNHAITSSLNFFYRPDALPTNGVKSVKAVQGLDSPRRTPVYPHTRLTALFPDYPGRPVPER